MIWCPVTDTIKWRRVISKFNDPTLSRSLSISLGDWVYVDQISSNLDNPPSSQWYYGFKCGASKMCGIFPVSCTEKPSDGDLPEIYAEILSFLPVAHQMFMVGDRRVFHKAILYLKEVTDCNGKIWHSLILSESKKHKYDALGFLSLCERYIGFPLQIRIPNPLSCISVHLYEKYLQNEKESKERERPKSAIFNVCIKLGRCPPTTLTLFLASQSMRLPDSASGTNGQDLDCGLTNVYNNLLEFLKGNDDGSIIASLPLSTLQFTDLCRISENAVVDYGHHEHKTSVIFTEIRPFSPSETRILLFVLADGVGPTMPRKGRNAATDSRLSVSENERIRRPLGVGCIDITKDILPTLLPFYTPRSFGRQPKKSSISLSRTVALRNSTETCHPDVLVKLANETRSSVWDMLHSSTIPKLPENVTVGSNLPPSSSISQTNAANYDGSEELDVELKDVNTLELQPYHLVRREYPGAIIARPYGIIEGNFSSTETVRNDFFVTIKSASFEKTSGRKEYNIEVVVSLRDSSGRAYSWIEGTEETQYVSTISSSRNQPRWNELVRIAIPWSLTSSCIKCPDARFSHWRNSLDGSSVVEDHIEPVISTSSSPRSSGDSTTFSLRNPTSAHLRFVIRHRSTVSEPRDKVLGVAFLPLGSPDEQTFIKDSDYSLFIYKMDEQEISECKYLGKEAIAFVGPGSINSSGSGSGNKNFGLGKYENGLSHGSMAASLLNSMANSFSGRTSRQPDTLNIVTLLCSNQYTTDEHLAKILSWRENLDDVVFCLKLLISHAEKESELKKFRVQLIDCLLQILSASDAADSSVHVQELHRFTVALLARLYRELNNNAAASASLEEYLKSPLFVYSGVHLNYLQVFIDLLSRNVPSRVDSTSAAEGGLVDVGKICTTFGWAFKVIARSRELEVKRLKRECLETLEKAERRFISAVDDFFGVILDITASGNDQLLKSHLFKHISETIDSLASVYPQRNLSKYFERLVQCTVQSPNLPNHNILSGCLRSVLMENTGCREILIPPIIVTLKRLFSTNLDITLEPCRSETNSMMTYFCNILTLFMERFVDTVISSNTSTIDSTHPEFHHQFVQQGLLRWVMREYGRILISLQRMTTSTPNSRPASYELTCTGGPVPFALHSPVKARFISLQPVLGCLASVFTSILQQLQSYDWEVLLTPKHQPRLNCVCAVCVGLEFTDTADFLHELFSLFFLSHSWPAYPDIHETNRPFKYHNLPTYLAGSLSSESIKEQPWVEMLALQSTVELKTIKTIFEVCLQPYFMCNDNSSVGKLDASHQKSRLLIISLQRCLGSFITSQPHLWLEELPTVTMVATAPRLPNGCLGDLRVSAGLLLEQLWQGIGQLHQTRYMESFIPTIMNASTEPVSELRKICVKMLVDMLRVNPLAAEPFLIREVDRVMNWAFPDFSTEMLSLLDAEVPRGAIDSLDRRLSIGLRRGTPVKPTPSNLQVTAEKSRIRIIGDMIRQINYLREYGEVITRRSKLSGMLAINNLRTYYDSIKRKDMTIRYLFKLEELHEQSENYVERGYTLERISGQYNWSSNPVDISEVSARYANLGVTSSSTLKEALLLDALKYLKTGGDWKRAIEVCDQLVVFYRDVTADLSSLSSILSEQSQLYRSFISGEARNQCCYKYYALHFSTRQDSPGFIGSTVVYRTLSQMNEVKMTLCEQFPEYHVETHNPQPLTTILTQVTDDIPTIRLVGNLQPVPELPPNWASGEAAANLSPHIRAYYEWNQVRQFTRTYHFKPSKSADGKEMPVAEEVRYILCEKLPNIVSFMPVEDIITRTLSKVELVINMVQDMSRSLGSMIAEITSGAGPRTLLSNFVGKLGSSIYSPVSGGLTALLTSVNLVDDSADDRQSEQLSDAVFQLLEVQAEGLALCHNLESSSEAGGSIASLLPTMLEQYYSLIREMSVKFGISVSQLQDRIQFGGPEHSSRTSSPTQHSLHQAERVYRRATNVPASQSIRARLDIQQDLSFFSDDCMDSPLSLPTDESRKGSAVPLLPQTPPPLPERPADLPPLNGVKNETASDVGKFCFANLRSPQVALRQPSCGLPLDAELAPGRTSSPDINPPPLPKKPPKPPPRASVYPVT